MNNLKSVVKQINNYKIHLIKTTKFKTISVKICFKRKLNKEDIIMRNLLGDILIMSNKKYKNKQEMEKKCEELFGFNLSINNKKVGNHTVFNFDASFLNEKYTEIGMNKESINFIKEVLLNPNVINNAFNEFDFDLVKRAFKEDVISINENATSLGIVRMRRHMDKDSLFSMHPLFLLDELEKITPFTLFEYYLDMLKNDEIDIYILGDVGDNIIDEFKDLNIGKIYDERESYYVEHNSFRDKENIVIENEKFNQSKLSMIFKLKDLTDFERKYVLYVYSFILGGTAGSILFKKLRLDNSLCYYVNSNYNSLYNILEIMAGINSKEFDKSVSLIEEAMNDIKNNNYEEAEIENAKTTYINAVLDIIDSPFGIIGSFLANDYYGADKLEEKIEKIKKVTKEDLNKLSNKIIIDTIYLLKGDSENEENWI